MTDRWASTADLRAGAFIVAALAGLGALLGVLWQWWSPPGPLGYVIAPHAVQPNESEAWIAADGRFAVIGIATGLLAAVIVWLLRPTRGPVALAALAVGGLAGSALTELVGHLLAGGRGNGPTNTYIRELPLSLHMHGLLLAEAGVAVLVYGLCVAFARQDDLGRPEQPATSVQVDEQPQYGRGYGDAASAFQQPYLPPQ
ncbi:MAG: hypothetical protein JWO57_2101 [Pseudonocardiales bacterium]|nr:hypothetical protein [Pseudonocardiales bacterium]